ncbi:ribosome silencing factor [Ahrensia sp. 13_GOM-1096m]|uniref:ribosome silencing factor n=1 Tax=Ahrensia sp. 13_GOM-1096m TaxID=1380380 RepID=UPI00047EF1FA
MRTANEKKVKQPSASELSGTATAQRIYDLVMDSLDSSKAIDIIPINIRGKSALADYMVVASGTSHRHVNAVADQLLRTLKEQGLGTSRVEGLAGADWVLVDAGDVVVHIFRPEVREFYQLEKIWSEDADTVH